MPAHITLRMQFGPHQDAEDIGRQLVQFVREARPNEIMFFYFAEELNDGYDTLDGVQRWIDHSRVYRQRVADEGILVSLNPWHTLMHAQRGRRLKPGQDWQTLVSDAGEQATCMVCPLDPKWRAYFAATLEMYAREEFRVIWIDDDIRFHNHTPIGWSCFCPRHVAEFNRRAGESATRERIVANCTAPGDPHPWRQAWLDMWEDTQLDLLDQWRRIVQSQGRHLGLMTSLMENHAAEGRRWERWWQAVRGDASRPLFVRPYYWGYEEMSHKEFAVAAATLDHNRVMQPTENVENGPEVECITYGRWNKSFRQIHAQMSLGLMLGASHLNVSLFDPMGNRFDDEPHRAAFLARVRPNLDWLAETFPMSMRTHGIGCPVHQDMSRHMHTEVGGGWQSLVCPWQGWVQWLNAAGHAVSRRPSSHVNALYGAGVWASSDEQLREWLGAGLLLDAAAAEVLIERGFGEFIGLSSPRWVTQQDMPYSFEQVIDANFGLRLGASMSVNKNALAPRLLQGTPAPSARMATDVRGPTNRTLGHGVVLFANPRGGRVATFPWEVHRQLNMNAQRVAMMHKLLRWLDSAGALGYAEDATWVVPLFLNDATQWRGVIWNVNPDAVDGEVAVHLPAAMPLPRRAVQVDAAGSHSDAAFADGSLTLVRPLHQWEYVVLC